MREFALVGGICHRKPERKRRTSVSRWLWCWQKLISLWNQNYIYLCSHSLLPTRTKLQSTLASRHCLRPDHMISVRQLTLCPTCRNYFMTLRPSQKIRNGFCIIHTGVHKKKKMFSKLDQRCFFLFYCFTQFTFPLTIHLNSCSANIDTWIKWTVLISIFLNKATENCKTAFFVKSISCHKLRKENYLTEAKKKNKTLFLIITFQGHHFIK